ncbi:MAG: hypothetical protein AAF677_04365 [Pseudomonadota bacterium]
MTPRPFALATVLIWSSVGTLAVAQDTVTDRFDPDRPAVAQVEAQATRLGIPLKDVTQAIFAGQYAPHLDDLNRAARELADVDCEAIFQEWSQSVAMPPESARLIFDCDHFSGRLGDDLDSAWAERFGRMTRANALQVAKRQAFRWHQGFGKPDWAAPGQTLADMEATPATRAILDEAQGLAPFSVFTALWADEEYAPKRCVYTQRLAALNPDIAPDCKDAEALARRDRALSDLGKEAALAQAGGDLFGDAITGAGSRLRLMAHGAFDALEFRLEQDADALSESLRARPGGNPVGPILDFLAIVTGTGRPGDTAIRARETARKRRYAEIAATYILSRMALHGDCGLPTVALRYSRSVSLEWRNGFGHYLGSGPTYTATDDFTVDRRFERTVLDLRAAPQAVPPAVFAPFGPIVRRLPCDSEVRAILEDNMLAFMAGEPPVHRRDLDTPFRP